MADTAERRVQRIADATGDPEAKERLRRMRARRSTVDLDESAQALDVLLAMMKKPPSDIQIRANGHYHKYDLIEMAQLAGEAVRVMNDELVT